MFLFMLVLTRGLDMQPKLVLGFRSPYFNLRSAGITGVCRHVQHTAGTGRCHRERTIQQGIPASFSFPKSRPLLYRAGSSFPFTFGCVDFTTQRGLTQDSSGMKAAYSAQLPSKPGPRAVLTLLFSVQHSTQHHPL